MQTSQRDTVERQWFSKLLDGIVNRVGHAHHDVIQAAGAAAERAGVLIAGLPVLCFLPVFCVPGHCSDGLWVGLSGYANTFRIRVAPMTLLAIDESGMSIVAYVIGT